MEKKNNNLYLHINGVETNARTTAVKTKILGEVNGRGCMHM